MTFADCRPQTADCRLQIADCKLTDTKNLPNKGDVFKNIKSCESEKVALGTRLIFLCKVTLASHPKCCWLFFSDPLLTHPLLTLNRQIIAHTQVLVHRWGPRRIGIPALFHRQTYSLVSSVVQAKLLDCCYGFMSKFVTSADIILL